MGDKKTPGIRDAEESDRQTGIKAYFMIGRMGCQEARYVDGRRRRNRSSYYQAESRGDHEQIPLTFSGSIDRVIYRAHSREGITYANSEPTC